MSGGSRATIDSCSLVGCGALSNMHVGRGRLKLGRAIRLSMVNDEDKEHLPPASPAAVDKDMDTRSVKRFEKLIERATPEVMALLHTLRGLFKASLQKGDILPTFSMSLHVHAHVYSSV